jgi:hypothetical protein
MYQRRWRRTDSSEEAGPPCVKKQGWSKMSERPGAARTSAIPTHNYFAPLRMVEVDLVSTATDGAELEPVPSSKRLQCQKR